MVFYRKYRPQQISDLDLVSVRKRLESILAQKEIPHAFLFTGSKGLGKTSTARILAKAINCENRKGIEPCNACDACKSITNGSNLDVLEIDAASNRGIDEIRELRERIKFAPATLTKKVYIIDEVHMLTSDAFNALLKTLEEPPAHAVFILCTTELDRVPPTITSRTFHIVFQKPTREEALTSLRRVVAGEGLSVEEKVLEDILNYSDNSFRDATKILQELSIAAGEGKITSAVLDATYATENNDVLCSDLLGGLAQKNALQALTAIQKLFAAGADFKVITERLTKQLHEIVLLRSGVIKEGEDIEGFSDKDIAAVLALLNDSYRDIKGSVFPQLPLELVVMEWCGGREPERADVESKLEVGKEVISASIPKSGSPKKAKEEDDDKTVVETVIAEEKPQSKIVASEGKSSVGMFSENVMPETFFQALLDRVKKDNHSIAGILRGCKLLELGQDKAIFEAKYKFHRDKLNEAKTLEILDRRASELLNRDIRVVVEMVAK